MSRVLNTHVDFQHQFLHLQKTQNSFQLLFFFFLFLTPGTVFGRTGKSFLNKFRQLFLQTYVTKIGSTSLVKQADYCVYVLKFYVCKHDMSCALEISNNG